MTRRESLPFAIQFDRVVVGRARHRATDRIDAVDATGARETTSGGRSSVDGRVGVVARGADARWARMDESARARDDEKDDDDDERDDEKGARNREGERERWTVRGGGGARDVGDVGEGD